MTTKDYDLFIHTNSDAQAWAKFFMQTMETNPNLVIDEELMITWFANAMMSMHDHLILKGNPINGECEYWEPPPEHPERVTAEHWKALAEMNIRLNEMLIADVKRLRGRKWLKLNN